MNGYDPTMYNGPQFGSARMMPPPVSGVQGYPDMHGQMPGHGRMQNPNGIPDGVGMNTPNSYPNNHLPPPTSQMRNINLNEPNSYNSHQEQGYKPPFSQPPVSQHKIMPTSNPSNMPSDPGFRQLPPHPLNRMPGPPISTSGMQPPGPGQLPARPHQTAGPPHGQGQPVGQYPSVPGQFPPMRQPMPPGPGSFPAGQISQGQLPPDPGRMPPGHSQLAHGPGQMPPGPGQFPPGPGQMPPGSGQLPPGPGQMPPAPGQRMPGPPGQHPHYGQQPQQPRRLDPDAMPSPIQVFDADIAKTTEPFRTDTPGLVPPLVTTKFVVEDCGSASPRYVRCATYNLPATADISKTCQVPMALAVKPLARLPPGEAPPLVVDPGSEGPIRCKRCKAYMCPQFKFTDGGRRFQCVMCLAITDTPHYYFDHVDHMNQRVDKYQRAELCRGSYEFITTKDYCRNDEPPNPPAYIFAIDVSYNAVKCGLVDLLCKNIKDLLDNLPCDVGAQETAIRVAFFTYNNTLHFYNLKSTLAQPQMLVVSDVSDVFVPLQDGFLVSVKESRHVINSLLEQIPEMFADTRDTEVVLAPVIQAAVQAMKSAKCAGKLFLFLTSLPTAEAPGKLKMRDDRKVIGTDKEKGLFSPVGSVYSTLEKDCVSQGCCIDLFLFPNQYIDVATIGHLALATGGDVFKYNFFRPEVDGERFISNLAYDIERDIVFDAILRVRTSAGIRAVNFAGALSMSNTTDVELAGLDCDKSISVELKHDDKISEELGVLVQIALLYTSVGGQRRLRIHNVNLAACNQIADLYRSCEADVLINYFAKTSIIRGQQVNKIREDLIGQVANILAAYRKHCATPSSAGQLILPECMKLLPVYLNSVLKNDAIHSSQEISTDDRAYLRQLVLGMDVAETQVFFYPRLFPVRSFSPPNLPKPVRCSEERLLDSEAYLLDNGLSFFLWIGNAIDPEWIRCVFGVQSAAQIDIDSGKLHPFDNPQSQQLRDLMELIQSGRTRRMKLAIIRQRDKLEPWFKHFLVEDRGLGGGASYVDFLCHVHKEIRAILA